MFKVCTKKHTSQILFLSFSMVFFLCSAMETLNEPSDSPVRVGVLPTRGERLPYTEGLFSPHRGFDFPTPSKGHASAYTARPPYHAAREDTRPPVAVWLLREQSICAILFTVVKQQKAITYELSYNCIPREARNQASGRQTLLPARHVHINRHECPLDADN